MPIAGSCHVVIVCCFIVVCLVQNATPTLLLDGSASVACVKPLKPSTFEVLSFVWRRLRAPTAVADHPALASPGDDTAFLGLSHDTLIARVSQGRVLVISSVSFFGHAGSGLGMVC